MKRYLVEYSDDWDPTGPTVKREVTLRDDRQNIGAPAAAWEIARMLTNHWSLVRIRDLDSPATSQVTEAMVDAMYKRLGMVSFMDVPSVRQSYREALEAALAAKEPE